jgi:cytidine deaminase
MIPWPELIAAARHARTQAYAPYSRYAVGAALLMEDGSIVAGCNVENRTYGLTVCAERAAMVSAVARGLRRPSAAVVVTASSPPAPPCGLCRETLIEFAGDLPLLLVNETGEQCEVRLAELLPMPFRLDP